MATGGASGFIRTSGPSGPLLCSGGSQGAARLLRSSPHTRRAPAGLCSLASTAYIAFDSIYCSYATSESRPVATESGAVTSRRPPGQLISWSS